MNLKSSLISFFDLLKGGDLARYIKDLKKNKEKLPEEKILYWLSQLLSACHYLHKKKILHRNIKPG
jgi:serine/threonine protein kinase